MKRYKMDRQGQIPIVGAEEGNGPWSVRGGFLILMPITIALVGVYLLFQYLLGN